MQKIFEIKKKTPFYENVCPCGARISDKYIEKYHLGACPVCGRTNLSEWKRELAWCVL